MAHHTILLRRVASWIVPGVLLAILPVVSQAQVVQISPFTGTLTENFDTFSNGSFASGTSVFNSSATLTGSSLRIWGTTGIPFDLGDNGSAKPNTATKGLGAESSNSVTSITFTNTVTRFGGYFGALRFDGDPSNPGTVTLSLFDSGNVLIGSSSFNHNVTGTGTLQWFGLQSNGNAVKRVEVSGNFVALDSLQASSGIIPEPATIGLLAMGLMAGAGIARRRRG